MFDEEKVNIKLFLYIEPQMQEWDGSGFFYLCRCLVHRRVRPRVVCGEKLRADEQLILINSFLRAMDEIIKEYNGKTR